MSYTIVELSNRYYSDQAHNMGSYVSNHATEQEANEECERLNAQLDAEYDQYEHPYDNPPFRYVAFNTNDHQ